MISTAKRSGEVVPRLRVCSVDGFAANVLIERRATDADRQAAAPHRRPLRARQTLVARALVRRLLEEATGQRGGQWEIVKDGEGRPSARLPGGCPGPDISIAHSGRWVACGVVDHGRIGIDIEVARAGRAVHDLANAVLSPAERAAVDAEGQTALLAFWTMREAIAKAVGGGMAIGLGLDGTILPACRNCWGSIMLDGRPWSLMQHSLKAFSIALAWSTATSRLTTHGVPPDCPRHGVARNGR